MGDSNRLGCKGDQTNFNQYNTSTTRADVNEWQHFYIQIRILNVGIQCTF